MLFYLLSNSNYLASQFDINDNKLLKIVILGTIVYIIIHGLIVADTKLSNYFWIIVLLDITSLYVLNIKNDTKLTISKGGNHNVPANYEIDLNNQEQENNELEEEEEEEEIKDQDDNALIEEILSQSNNDIDNDIDNNILKKNNTDDEIDYSEFEKGL